MLPIRRVILHVLPLLIIACAAHAAAPTGQKQGIHFDQVTYTNSGLTARVNLPAGTTEVGESGLYTFLAVAQDSEVQMNLNSSGDRDAWQVNAGNAMTWRGLHLVPLSISRSGELPIPPVAEELNIEINYSGPPAVEPIRVSTEMAQMLSSMILNITELDIQTVSPVGRLLVVMEDNPQLHTAIEPYVQWKRQQGYRVTVAAPDDNTSSASIKALILQHYTSNDPVPLEHVLLVGDHDASSAIQMVGYRRNQNTAGNETDHWYSVLEGGNTLVNAATPNVSIGRFSVREVQQLYIATNKTLNYERDGALDDPSWMSHAGLVGDHDSGISVIETNQIINWMLQHQGIESDSLWYTMPNGGQVVPFITNQINSGTGFINYRGIYGMGGWTNDDCDNLFNTDRLPFVVTLTCGTGSWGSELTALSEGFFRAGTVTEPTGAVACIGTGTTLTHTRFNNIMDAGIFEAFAMHNIRSLGWCLVGGKVRLAQAYNGTDDASDVVDFCDWNNLMGDPTLRLWTRMPDIPVVSHPQNLSPGQNYVDVDVQLPGEWPDMIWATVASADNVIDSRLIDPSGHIQMQLGNLPDNVGPLTLTVVGNDVRPYQAQLSVQAAPISPQVTAVQIDDVAAGNGDGIANPAETITLDLTVQNFGSQTLQAGIASIIQDDPWIESVDAATFNHPDITPGSEVTISDAITLTLSDWAPDLGRPELTVEFGVEQRCSAVLFEVVGWTMIPHSELLFTDHSSDGRILPGETGEVAAEVTNIGSVSADGLLASLLIDDPRIDVLNNPVSFADVDQDSVRDNLDEPFLVSLSNGTIAGELIPCHIRFEDTMGAVDSVAVTLIVGDPRIEGATGPDLESGYWAIDEQDTTLALCPIYNWVDNIAPENDLGLEDNHSGDHLEEDESLLINLPFPFIYYGQIYQQITVNTNGWIAMGDAEAIILFRNWPIPNPLGPPAMIAPWWDDLHTGDGGVYASYDEQNGRFIITWDCQSAIDAYPERFQVVLHDPTVWPTRSGNGRILFQYEDVTDVDSIYDDNGWSTVGIESPDQQSGIQYLYWRIESEGATTPSAGHAILFTDDLDPTGSTSEGEITPDYVDVTLIGAEEADVELNVTNVGDGMLIWMLDSIGGSIAPLYPGLAPALAPFSGQGSGFGVGSKSESHSIETVSRPDDWGYFWMDEHELQVQFEWLEPPGATVFTEDDLIRGNLDNGYYRPVEMPFSFPHYDSWFDSVVVSPNGYIVFLGDLSVQFGTNQNRILPSTWAPHRLDPASMIAVWWDDLNLELGGEVSVWTGVEDSVLVTWDGVYAQSHPGGPYTFQALLFKNGFIKLQYLDMDPDALLSATVGMQNHNASVGLQVVCEQPFMQNERAVMIGYPPSWFTPLNSFGLLAPGESDIASFRIHGRELMVGTLDSEIRVRLSDPNNPVRMIPLSVTVEGGGQPPTVLELPDIILPFGSAIDSLELDDYVVDNVWSPENIRWSVSGNEELQAHVFARTLYVDKPGEFWHGQENLTLTATNPEHLSDSGEMIIRIGTSVAEHDDTLPREFEVAAPYPNPFNPSVSLKLALPSAVEVVVEVHDVLGRTVDRRSYGRKAAGWHRLEWAGPDRSSGVYFFHVRAGEWTALRKAVLVK